MTSKDSLTSNQRAKEKINFKKLCKGGLAIRKIQDFIFRGGKPLALHGILAAYSWINLIVSQVIKESLGVH